MIARFPLVFLLTLCATLMSAQTPTAYQLFDARGKRVKYKKMRKQLAEADVILFGEFHNNPIAHWLQLKIAQDLHRTNQLVLGAEMLERDNQTAVDRYLTGEIDYRGLDTLARLWSNFKTDYAPLVDFARDNKLPFIATNVPRRYANRVFRDGGFAALEDLPAEERAWVAPLPVAFDASLPQYQKMFIMMDGHAGGNVAHMVQAQAIKDATMAHSILEHHAPGKTILHFNGAYHSDFYEGILWYLQQTRPELTYVTITTVEQANPTELAEEHEGRADFILTVDEDMTKTYLTGF